MRSEHGYSDEDADSDSSNAYGDQYWEDLAMKVQWALSRRGYYHGPIDGVIGPLGISAIQAFQEAQGLPVTGLIDPNVLRALELPVPQVSLRSN
jgi:peptidoglycan hydrolase-like protein with peptidoglycan-binding domain